MRIGMVAGEYAPMQGGVGAYTRILAQALADLGHELFLYARQGSVEPDTRLHLTAHVSHERSAWGVRTLHDIRRWSEEFQPDVINLQYQTAAFDMSGFIHVLPHRVSQPWVTTFHDLRFPYLFPKAGPLRPWSVDWLARSSDGAIATNAEDQAHLADLTTTALIPIGSNILAGQPHAEDAPGALEQSRSALRQQIGAQPGDFLIGFFGLVNVSKGLDMLIESLSALRAEHMPARLLIIGGTAGSSDPTNAEYLKSIQALAARLGLDEFIHWTGYLDEADVSAHLAACDAVVLPFQDGASMRRGSLMAALRGGCAIVTTEPNTTTPLFIDEENMLLVPPHAPALAAALRRLRAEPALAAQLREGARLLSAHFEWPQIARQTADFFQQIIERRRP